MITITKNGKMLLVPRAAFNANYKNQGWSETDKISKEEAKTEKIEAEKTVVQAIPEKTDEEMNEEEIENINVEDDWHDKPISEMSKEEVKRYADELGIETRGKNVREVKEEIISKIS